MASVDKETIYKRIRVATCSDQRRKLLFSLDGGKKSLRDLRDEFHWDSATIVHALRELEKNHFVREDVGREYFLTPIGRTVVRKVLDLRDIAETFALHEAFWLEHDVTGIPDYLFDRIGSLRNSELVIDTPVDLFGALHAFAELIEERDMLELITPIYVPEVAKRLGGLTSDLRDVHFVVTEEVLQSALEEAAYPHVKNLLQGDIKVYVVRWDPKLIFAFTGKAIGLALAHVDGPIDYSKLLISRSGEAIEWGRELFRYYVQLSESAVL